MINSEREERQLLALIIAKPQETFDEIDYADFGFRAVEESIDSTYHERVQLFDLLRKMLDKGEPINGASIQRTSEAQNNRKRLCAELQSVVATFPKSSASELIDTVNALQTRRALQHGAKEITAQADDMSVGVEDVVENCAAITDGFVMREDHMTIEALTTELTEQVARVQDGEQVYITTGVPAIDKGMQYERHGFYLITGKAGSCKTTLTVTGAVEQARLGVRVDFYTLEQTAGQIVRGIICRMGGWSVLDVMTGAYRPNANAWQECVDIVNNLPISIFDGRYTNRQLAASIKRRATQDKCDISYVDYMQRIKSNHQQSEYERVSESSAILADAAKLYGPPVVGVSSLSKDGTMRGSGTLEFDGYGIIEAQRHSEQGELPQGDFVITKNRYGRPDFKTDWSMDDKGGISITAGLRVHDSGSDGDDDFGYKV